MVYAICTVYIWYSVDVALSVSQGTIDNFMIGFLCHHKCIKYSDSIKVLGERNRTTRWILIPVTVFMEIYV